MLTVPTILQTELNRCGVRHRKLYDKWVQKSNRFVH